MSNTVSMEDFKKESRRREIVEKVKNGASNAYQKARTFCINNKEVVVPVAITLATGTVKVTKQLLKARNIKEDERIKEEYCYDRSLGHYWALRKPLSNKEWLEIDSRKQNGERLADILSDMRVLK